MCLLPLAVRTELAILDKQQSYIFLINWRQLHCIFVSFFVQKKIWLQEEWGALFPAGWHGHRRPSFLLPPFRFSSITNSQRGSLIKPKSQSFPCQVLFGVATLLCVRTIFNNILESVGLRSYLQRSTSYLSPSYSNWWWGKEQPLISHGKGRLSPSTSSSTSSTCSMRKPFKTRGTNQLWRRGGRTLSGERKR